MSTTYTSISDTSFSIKFTTANYNQTEETYSERKKHCGLEWAIFVCRSNEDKLQVILHCYGNNSNGWSTKIKNTTNVWKNDSIGKTASYIKDFDSENKCWGFISLLPIATLSDGYIQDGKINVEVIIDILSIFGNQPEKKHDFLVEDSKFSDVALMVEGKHLYVNRKMLGFFSPVFHAMFFSDFAEKSKDVVELKDEKFDEFERYLQLLHHCSVEIDAKNVESLLMLADRYNTPEITQKCESFLHSTIQVKNNQKLAYAEQFQLLGLQTKCINDIDTTPKLEEACVEMEKRDKKTLMGLLTKAISMLKK